MEIKPEGNGWQSKDRLSHFQNIPEIMNMFLMIADIKTAEMLDEVPVPKLATEKSQIIEATMTPDQKVCMEELVQLADDIRNRRVESNFLVVTQQARKLAVDPRILNDGLINDPDSKLNLCGRKVAEIYKETAENRLTQMVFCDQGVPTKDGSFNFYAALVETLVDEGVFPDEIAIIHDYDGDDKKSDLYEKLRNGEIRILIGSTGKCGTGMNIQDKLYALHHIDIPWKPSDLTQRNGRILRQGNGNQEVSIYNYVTKGSFDSYLWQILEKKQRFISQIMKGDATVRCVDDMNETVLEYAEIKALAIDNPKLKEKMDLDNQVIKLNLLKSSWQAARGKLQKDVTIEFPSQIKNNKRLIDLMLEDEKTLKENLKSEFEMVIEGEIYTEKSKASQHLGTLDRKLGSMLGDTKDVGEFAGFKISLMRIDMLSRKFTAKGKHQYSVDISDSMLGAIVRLENLLKKIPENIKSLGYELEEKEKQYNGTQIPNHA